jgi:predicted RNase H-related nuclease YkuK (DUF458 family)
VNLKFRKIDGTPIEDIAKYCKEYIETRDGEVEIMIGADSLPKGRRYATYTTVVVIYTVGKGAHIIFSRQHRVSVSNDHTRLWAEVEKALGVATYLRDNGITDMPAVKSLDISIHLDFNKDAKHLSNSLHDAAIGYVKAMGFDCHTKPEAPAASYAADRICRGLDLISSTVGFAGGRMQPKNRRKD